MQAFLYLILVLVTPAVFAHGALHDQADELTHRIETQPANAELYLIRGRIYLEDGHDDEASDDFRQALRLDKNARFAHYFLGQLALRHKHYDEAEKYAAVFVELAAGEPASLINGYRLLGEIHSGKKEFRLAAQAYQAAIDHAKEPRPEFYIELADVYAKLGGAYYTNAINTLEQGIQQLGPLSVLQDKAVQIQLAAGTVDAALDRLDTLIAQGQRLPELYELKGRVLHNAGRDDEALYSYQLALVKLDQLPLARRNTDAMKTLRSSIVAAME